DLAVIAVPAKAVPDAVADAGAAGAHGVVVISAGFAETGERGAAEQERVLRIARAAGMRLVGPNCLGIANTDPRIRLNATLAPRLPDAGRVGFFSQSGAFGVALLAEADRRGLGLSSFVSAGNRADVSANDLLQYWQDDPATDVILLYLESFGNPRKFARLARRIGRTKPIVALASPARTDATRDVAGPDAAGITALFAQSGVIRVDTVAELFDVGVLLASQPLPAGDRIGIVGNSSALVGLATTACAARGLVVAPGYPRDVGPQAGASEFGEALAATADDDNVDALVVVYAPPLPGQPADDEDAFASVLASVALAGEKPTVAAFLAGRPPAGVPAYPSVEEAVRALARRGGHRQQQRQPPGTIPALSNIDPQAARISAAEATPERLLAAYGIDVVPAVLADSAEAAVARAREFGYPVALKAAVEGLRHRFDLGAVRLNLGSDEAVARAYAEIATAFGRTVLVQPMVEPGVACVVESVEDSTFGPVVGFGLGGVAMELLGDRAWRAAPLTDRDAAELIDEPRAAPLLRGYGGAAPVDRDALAELLVRVGRLVDEHPEVRALRLNPVLVRPSGLSVLHATVHIGEPGPRPDTGPRRL
ncbi:MAG: GNAT family N-acetyltransferase, partial [Actinobacteria bacterium]